MNKKKVHRALRHTLFFLIAYCKSGVVIFIPFGLWLFLPYLLKLNRTRLSCCNVSSPEVRLLISLPDNARSKMRYRHNRIPRCRSLL